MSEVLGVQATKIAAGGIANQCAEGVQDARLKCIVDSYEASALATNSTITMGGELPAGARIQEIILSFDSTLNANNTLEVGDSNDADRYASVAGSGAVVFQRLEMVDGQDYVIGTASGDNQVVIHTTGASAATGTIKLAIFYTKD